MELKNTYTDARGLRIPDEDIISAFVQCSVTEDSVIKFVGDIAKEPGFMSAFLQTLGSQISWYREGRKNNRKWLNSIGDIEGFDRVNPE